MLKGGLWVKKKTWLDLGNVNALYGFSSVPTLPGSFPHYNLGSFTRNTLLRCISSLYLSTSLDSDFTFTDITFQQFYRLISIPKRKWELSEKDNNVVSKSL